MWPMKPYKKRTWLKQAAIRCHLQSFPKIATALHAKLSLISMQRNFLTQLKPRKRPVRPDTYRIITTGDGTRTLFSSDYREAMHSLSGAYEEALHKHVIPSRILDQPGYRRSVLDVGCGLGYNMYALIKEYLGKGRGAYLSITSFETDFSFLPLIESVVPRVSRDPVYESIVTAMTRGAFDAPGYDIRIFNMDARSGIRDCESRSFDAVFHDPYSPSKNPELWTVEFFTEARRIMKDPAILTTYSSAVQVRRAMLDAGLKIGRGPSVGKKKEGTLATIAGSVPLMSEAETFSLLEDPKATPYRDPGFVSQRAQILQRRTEEIRLKKDPRAPL
jgi:tRNA U34 5-methylaminomethyl-2-thiouridine-forming methyltransferase MnmC